MENNIQKELPKIYIKNTVNDIPSKMIEITKDFIINKNRRYFGKSGTSLRNQLDDPKYEKYNINRKLVTAGIDGEKKTTDTLLKWIKDKPEIIMIDSISLPIQNFEPEEDGEEGQLDLGDTDHVLIIGDIIIIIDSKNWKNKATYRFSDEGEIIRNGNEFPGNRPRINEAKYLWEKYLEDYKIEGINAYVCISSDTPTIVRDKNWWRFGYKLVNQETLIYFLNRFYNETEGLKKEIQIDLIAKILMGLNRPYNKFKEKLGKTYERVAVK